MVSYLWLLSVSFQRCMNLCFYFHHIPNSLKKGIIQQMSVLLCVLSRDPSVTNVLHVPKQLCSNTCFSGYYQESLPLVDRQTLCFLCRREQVSVFALTLWGLFTEGLWHTQKFLTHLHHHPNFCSMFSGWERQIDKQTDRNWGAETKRRPSLGHGDSGQTQQ